MQIRSALEADDRFFAALLKEAPSELEQLLSDDFIMIDVMRGGQIGKAEFLGAITSGQLRFESIQRFDPRLRSYGIAAVVTGSTLMKMRFGEMRFEVHSRYTHVFIRQEDEWRLVSAQGTRIESDASAESHDKSIR